MKRLCIFAHWDRDNIIDDYVVYYLNAIKEICSTIVFVSDCNLSNTEKAKLNDITKHIIAEEHGEYDFGSYKRGYFYAKNVGIQFEEIVLINDSLYGPFVPLKSIFNQMDNKQYDYWGLTQNTYGIKNSQKGYRICYCPHIQSYFFVFKQQTFNIFENFINTVKPEKTKEEIIIKYEIGLNKVFKRAGFHYGVFINKYKHTENCTLQKWDTLIEKDHFPFIKTSIPRYGLPILGTLEWREKIPSSYPISLIENQLKRLKFQNFSMINVEKHDRFVYYIYKHCPIELFLVTRYIDKKFFSVIRRFFKNILKNF